MNKIACTNCELIADERATYGWLVVTSDRPRALGVDPPDGTFCTEKCVLTWFERRQAHA